MKWSHAIVPFVVVGTLIACAGRSSSSGGGTKPGSDGGVDDGGSSLDAAASGDATSTCNVPAPRRLPCLATNQLASAFPQSVYGAVEGELVAIIPPGVKLGGCPSDDAHVHLQIDVNGGRYDVAVDDGQADGVMYYYEATLVATLPAEGWMSAGFDYKTDLGVTSADFTQMTPAATDTKIIADLANVSRLTIHGMSYADGTGAHDVHYNGGTKDGVMLLHGQGTACGDKAVALHFKSDTF